MADGDLGRLVATLEARAENFQIQLQRSATHLEKIAQKTEAANARSARSHASLDVFARKAARGVSLLVGSATAAGAALAYFAGRQIQALDALGDLSQQTGLTATSLRQLQVGLELNGGTSAQAGEGMLTFSRNLALAEAGTGRFYSQIKKIDPAFAENVRSAGSMEAALRLVADRIAVARSEQEKLAIAQAAFGGAGRQFVLLLGEGARGLDDLRSRLEGLGIGDLDEVTAAAQRFDDQMKLLKGTVTIQFTKGLFGVGEGIDKVSGALDDETVKNLGEFAKNMGELVAAFTSMQVAELSAWTEFFNSLRKGEGFGASFEQLDLRLAPIEQLNEAIADSASRVAELDAALAELGDTGGALPEPSGLFDLEARNRRSEIEAARRERAEEEARLRRLNALATDRRNLPDAPAAGRGGTFDIAALRESLAPPGARGADKALETARAKLLADHQAFVNSMRESSAVALTEAQQISLKLAETLGKIGQAPTLTPAEKTEFQRAAIVEATAAIAKAEQDALAKQAEQVQGFLRQYGDATLNEAQRISLQLADQLRQLAEQGRAAGLSPKEISLQAGKLTAGAQPLIDAAQVREQGDVERDLLQRGAPRSEQLRRELEKAEAELVSRQLDQKIAIAFAGDDAKIEELQAKNHALLESELARIESGWDETLTTITDFGEQVFGDMVQGWVQGAEVNFRGIAQSFAAMILKMQAEAIAKDLFGALRGEEVGQAGLVGKAVGFGRELLGGEKKGDGAKADAERAELAGASISAQLLASIETGADSLVEAGRGAGGWIASSAESIWDAGVEVARSIAQALAGSGGGGGGGGWFSQILGLVGTAVGGYFGGPAGAAAGGAIGGAVGGGGGSGTLPTPVRAAKGAVIAPGGRFVPLAALAEGGAAADVVTALVGEGDSAERILKLDQVPGILARAGGSPSRAAQLAMRMGERVSSPKIRRLVPGDLVVPEPKLASFFERARGGMPVVPLAEGGFVGGLDAMRPVPMPAGLQGFPAGLSIKFEQTVQGGAQASQPKVSRGPSGEIVIQQMVTRAFGRDMQTNGPMAQRIAPNGPQGGLR